MGSNTITAVVAGTTSEDDLNQFRDALIGDLFPRDNTGAPADGAGSLGAPTIQFDKLFCKRLFQSGIEVAGDPEKIQPNDVISGATRSGSNQPQYLDPSGSGAGFTVLATSTPLQVDINSTLVEAATDIAGTSTLAPSSNNTCLVNDASAAAQYSTRTWGEYLAEKEAITVDTMGSEISNRVGQFAAFKVGSTEYFMAYIASSTSLQFAFRGFFYDTSGAPLNRLAFSNNDTITLMALNWVFLADDGATVAVTTRTPVWSAEEPSSPSTNDRWYDLTEDTWKKYNGSAFVVSDETWIGWVVSDSTNCVAARCREFAANYKEDNTIVLGNLANATVDSLRAFSIVNVCGKEIAFNTTLPQWNMASHLASSADLYTGSEQASRVYYMFVSDVGELKISDVHPYYRFDLKGYYHPHQPWRCVGYARNNGSSNFEYLSWFPGAYEDREKTYEEQSTVASNSFTTSWETYGVAPTFRKRGTYLMVINHTCESSDASTKAVEHRLQDTTAGTTIATWTTVTIQGGTALRTFLSLPKEVTITNLDDAYELQVQTSSGTATSEVRAYTSQFRDVLYMGR